MHLQELLWFCFNQKHLPKEFAGYGDARSPGFPPMPDLKRTKSRARAIDNPIRKSKKRLPLKSNFAALFLSYKMSIFATLYNVIPPVHIYAHPPYADILVHSCAFLLIAYLSILILTSIQTRKQRAWVLSLVASSVLVIGSLPSVYEFLVTYGGDISQLPTQLSDIDIGVCLFFAAFLVVDLVIGLVHYHDEIYLLSGWVHHIGYFVLITHLIHHKLTTTFCLLAMMEIPTFLLALGHISPSLRSDLLFGIVFFTTRLAFHAYMIKELWARFPVEGPWTGILAGIYPLHLYWFYAWTRSYSKRLRSSMGRKRKISKQVDMITPPRTPT
jgi:hypothetical protein